MVFDRQAFRRSMDEILTNAAINAILKEKRKRSNSLCSCHKFSGCVPHHFCNKYYACEVCQMCTDYCPNISFSNNIKSFIRFTKDILNRSSIIMQNIDKKEHKDPYNIKYKYLFTYFHETDQAIDDLIYEHLLFV